MDTTRKYVKNIFEYLLTIVCSEVLWEVCSLFFDEKSAAYMHIRCHFSLHSEIVLHYIWKSHDLAYARVRFQHPPLLEHIHQHFPRKYHVPVDLIHFLFQSRIILIGSNLVRISAGFSFPEIVFIFSRCLQTCCLK